MKNSKRQADKQTKTVFIYPVNLKQPKFHVYCDYKKNVKITEMPGYQNIYITSKSFDKLVYAILEDYFITGKQNQLFLYRYYI